MLAGHASRPCSEALSLDSRDASTAQTPCAVLIEAHQLRSKNERSHAHSPTTKRSIPDANNYLPWQQETPLSDIVRYLPMDVLLLLLEYIPRYPRLAVLSLVCRRWRAAVLRRVESIVIHKIPSGAVGAILTLSSLQSVQLPSVEMLPHVSTVAHLSLSLDDEGTTHAQASRFSKQPQRSRIDTLYLSLHSSLDGGPRDLVSSLPALSTLSINFRAPSTNHKSVAALLDGLSLLYISTLRSLTLEYHHTHAVAVKRFVTMNSTHLAHLSLCEREPSNEPILLCGPFDSLKTCRLQPYSVCTVDKLLENAPTLTSLSLDRCQSVGRLGVADVLRRAGHLLDEVGDVTSALNLKFVTKLRSLSLAEESTVQWSDLRALQITSLTSHNLQAQGTTQDEIGSVLALTSLQHLHVKVFNLQFVVDRHLEALNCIPATRSLVIEFDPRRDTLSETQFAYIKRVIEAAPNLHSLTVRGLPLSNIDSIAGSSSVSEQSIMDLLAQAQSRGLEHAAWQTRPQVVQRLREALPWLRIQHLE